MSVSTGIAWTDHTFNIAWGCQRVSPGCANCYAETLAKRYGWDVFGPKAERRTFGDKHWREPLAWNKAAEREGVRRRVFCSSMADVFEHHPTIDAERAKLWPLIQQTPWLDWQLLTKRAERIGECVPWDDYGDPWPNVWLGVSIESNEYVGRAAHLKRVPAAVRFVSYEPALGPLNELDLSGLHWIIYGGESGKNHRPQELDWARAMRDRCKAAGVAFFFKQGHGQRPGTAATLDGRQLFNFPKRHATEGQ